MDSPSDFSKKRHQAALKLIEKQVRFRQKIDATETSVNYHSKVSRECEVSTKDYHSNYADLALINIKLVLEDVLTLSIPDNDEDKGDQMVSKGSYIEMCKELFKEELCEKFQVYELPGTELLHSLLQRVFSVDVFTEKIHQKLIKWIFRELRLKAELSNMSLNYFYTLMHSVKNLELVLEDILEI